MKFGQNYQKNTYPDITNERFGTFQDQNDVVEL